MLRNIRFTLFVLCLFFSMAVKAQTLMDSLIHQSNDPSLGNPKAKVTLVEFFDYRCSYCAKMISPIASAVKSNNNLRVVFKEFPILSHESEIAARAALAAKQQGKYIPYSHALFSNRVPFNENSLVGLAKSLGLDVVKFKNDMSSEVVTKEIQATRRLAHRLNINGTPTFLITKTNARNLDEVKLLPFKMSTSDIQREVYKINP